MNVPRSSLLCIAAACAVIQPGCLATAAENTADPNGLYYVSSDSSGLELETPRETKVRLGEKADIRILTARVYSENNANRDFEARLGTTAYPAVDTQTVSGARRLFLRIGDRAYPWGGGGGRQGEFDEMLFKIHGQSEAKAAAKWLGVKCALRSHPGYRLLAQFVPTHPEYDSGGPIIVNFELRNVGDRTLFFRRGGAQRGARDNQYAFLAKFGSRIVPDTGDPTHFGGFVEFIQLKPGEAFTDEIDLKKWFAFDKAGRYFIQGLYGLVFEPGDASTVGNVPWSRIWEDCASAHFQVVVR